MATTQPPITVPDGFKLHTENTSHILLPSTNDAFLNPVQEFNRDISVACIRVWSEELSKAQEAKWRSLQERRAKNKNKRAKTADDAADENTNNESASARPGTAVLKEYKPHKFVILEALSATGLRSIRYAKEIPHVNYVIANDLSSAATAAMKRNIDLNGLGEPSDVAPSDPASTSKPRAKVQVNEGDACSLMYNHREERTRVDVVDLDPYGTAAPFIDAAVQCVNDSGLLCVTCTDLSVLATTNYPEKCFSNYGGIPLKAEYCHEAALRLVLHTISTSASRYGRYIEPLLSLSIDFYVRVFVRVKSGALDVKRAFSKTSSYYVCTGCQSFYAQPLGRVMEKVAQSGNVNYVFKTQPGPPVPDKCSECGSALHLAGPMWSDRLHDPEFVGQVLEHLGANEDKYGTATRMKGMLTVAKEELSDPFYFTPSKVASFFHCTCPPLDDVGSALLHAGHRISRSHACPGSLKTSATREDIHDVFRSWIKRHPVKMENISDTSPAKKLLAKEPRSLANFKRHPDTVTPSSKVKLVRYQQNPTANWGPGTKAVTGVKRKRDDDQETR